MDRGTNGTRVHAGGSWDAYGNALGAPFSPGLVKGKISAVLCLCFFLRNYCACVLGQLVQKLWDGGFFTSTCFKMKHLAANLDMHELTLVFH